MFFPLYQFFFLCVKHIAFIEIKVDICRILPDTVKASEENDNNNNTGVK